MSEAKFTKGPWTAQLSCVLADGKPLIAFVNSVVETKDCTEDYANAHLTAAAPDMYDELENMARKMHKMGLTDDRDAIHQLLAKARGE